LRLGLIYPCRCSRKDLEAALAAPHERNSTDGGAAISDEDEEPIYPGTCRPGARREYSSNIALAEESAALQFDLPEGLSWRFALQEGEKVDFEDRNLGPQRYVAGRDFGDFVVWRRDGVPSYQLACVVDDAAMRITEVVRGADLLKSTARQILLNRALGYENPRWYHCPLAVDRYGIRLAKRHDSLSLRALRQRGLTPTEALSVEMLAEPYRCCFAAMESKPGCSRHSSDRMIAPSLRVWERWRKRSSWMRVAVTIAIDWRFVIALVILALALLLK
jgi:glutamyl-tRNA synthetase